MGKLQLSVAIGDYDRMRPLVDGLVQIDGVDPQFMLLDPEEIFFRAFRHADFDICELSLSSYSVKTAAGTSAYIAVPVFPSRAFRHTAVYVRTDRIKKPADLKGRRIGVPEYQLTANIWVRLFLEEDYGVRPSDITWVRGGYEHPGRIEKISLNLPANVVVENARAGVTISDLLANGDARCGDGAARAFMLRARAPRCRLSLCRSAAGRNRLVPQDADLSDHAHARDSSRACRKASLVARGSLQGLRSLEGDRSRETRRHVRYESDVTFRGGTIALGPPFDGRGFLGLRPGAEPRGVATISGAPPCRGPILSLAYAGRNCSIRLRSICTRYEAWISLSRPAPASAACRHRPGRRSAAGSGAAPRNPDRNACW